MSPCAARIDLIYRPTNSVCSFSIRHRSSRSSTRASTHRVQPSRSACAKANASPNQQFPSNFWHMLELTPLDTLPCLTPDQPLLTGHRMFILSLAIAQSTGVTMSGGGKPGNAAHVAPVSLECSAFKKNLDGSWTSVRSSRIGLVSISANGTFFPGVKLNGADIGASLNAECRKSDEKMR
jgi:hypothetical protein